MTVIKPHEHQTDAETVSDHHLMSRLANGDHLALNTLMDRWSRRLVSFLYRSTGRHDTAVDLAQETFVRLYQARDRYRPGSGFSGWLFTIASNLAKNHARWRARHPEISLDETDAAGKPMIHEPVDGDVGPDQVAAGRETAERVRLAVLALPDDLREALVLLTYQGLGYAEIAQIAGCSPKAVETRVYRARQILKKTLKDPDR